MTRSSVLLFSICAVGVLGSNSSPLDDGVALLQSVANGNPNVARQYLKLLTNIIEGATNETDLAFKKFDCNLHPYFCQEPFNCHGVTIGRVMNWLQEGIGSNGPDLGAVCALPRNELYYHECLTNRNPVKAAHMQFLMTRENLLGGDPESDASYCFIEGLCVEDLDANSTRDDIVKVCDKRYGRELWTRFGSAKNPHDTSINAYGEVMYGEGFSFRSQAIPFSLSSCATGTFHCDVISCKETYCKDGHARRKYEYQMREESWVSSARGVYPWTKSAAGALPLPGTQGFKNALHYHRKYQEPPPS